MNYSDNNGTWFVHHLVEIFYEHNLNFMVKLSLCSIIVFKIWYFFFINVIIYLTMTTTR